MTAQRKRGGGAFGGAKFKDINGNRSKGTFKKLTPEATASKLGTKTSSNGFAGGGSIDADNISRDPGNAADKGRKDGGAIAGSSASPSLAKRARGGRTSAPFSNVHTPTSRQGSSSSGHEGE